MLTKQLTQSELNEALLSAAGHGETDKVKELITKCADPNAKGNLGNTPLIWAAYNGHTKTAELLLIHGADINAKNKDGFTPLIRAADYGHTETAELLLIHGADPTLKNNDGKTVEDLAREHNHNGIIELLRRVKTLKDVDKQLEYDKRIHNALRRKDPLTMTDGEFLDSLEAEITNGK